MKEFVAISPLTTRVHGAFLVMENWDCGAHIPSMEILSLRRTFRQYCLEKISHFFEQGQESYSFSLQQHNRRQPSIIKIIHSGTFW